MGAFEDGNGFLAGVFAKIPQELRAQAQDLFGKPEVKDAVTLIGDGVLARSDYSKNMDLIKSQDQELKDKLAAATALYEKNTQWYEDNKAALDAYPTLKEELDTLKAGGDGGTGGTAAIDKKAIEAMIASALDTNLSDRERGYVDVVGFMMDTGLEHLQRFGTKPDMRALVGNPKLGKPVVGQPGRVFSLVDAYNEKYGADVAAKDKADHDKLIEDQVQKRLTEERAKLISQPFPLRDAAPSVLDVLGSKDGTAAHTLDSAVAAYEALQANRG